MIKYNKVYVVMNNADRTEGRGDEYVYAVTELQSTAKRLAKGNYVQGTDCPVFEQELIDIDNIQYLPINRVTVISPTKADIENEKILVEKLQREKLRQGIISKALGLGLTEDEITALQNKE